MEDWGEIGNSEWVVGDGKVVGGGVGDGVEEIVGVEDGGGGMDNEVVGCEVLGKVGG